jgi:hypothetical protein
LLACRSTPPCRTPEVGALVDPSGYVQLAFSDNSGALLLDTELARFECSGDARNNSMGSQATIMCRLLKGARYFQLDFTLTGWRPEAQDYPLAGGRGMSAGLTYREAERCAAKGMDRVWSPASSNQGGVRVESVDGEHVRFRVRGARLVNKARDRAFTLDATGKVDIPLESLLDGGMRNRQRDAGRRQRDASGFDDGGQRFDDAGNPIATGGRGGGTGGGNTGGTGGSQAPVCKMKLIGDLPNTSGTAEATLTDTAGATLDSGTSPPTLKCVASLDASVGQTNVSCRGIGDKYFVETSLQVVGRVALDVAYPVSTTGDPGTAKVRYREGTLCQDKPATRTWNNPAAATGTLTFTGPSLAEASFVLTPTSVENSTDGGFTVGVQGTADLDL